MKGLVYDNKIEGGMRLLDDLKTPIRK